MKKLSIVILIILQSTLCFSQKQGNIWCFGDSALINWNDPQNPAFGRSASKNRGSASSISDSLGNLLFYVCNLSGISPDGYTCNFDLGFFERANIYTKEHTIMENGNCLSGEGWYNEHTIIPMPGNDSLYYKFSVNLYDHSGIDYSIIDMKANGGLGKVIERDVSLVSYESLGLNPIEGTIKAIRHGNGKDWWMVVKSNVNNVDNLNIPYFIFILVTENGFVLNQFSVEEPNDLNIGYSNFDFSADGTLFYSLDPNSLTGNLVVYNFDRCTGSLSNQKVIEGIPDNEGNYPLMWDAEFSPSGRYIYSVNRYTSCQPDNHYLLIQYDLQEENPALTRDTLLNYITGVGEGEIGYITAYGGFIELAPDGKIYHARKVSNCYDYWWPYPDTLYNYINMNLSVINNPDSSYPSTNFEEFSFYLGGARTYYGLPNNPNFALGVMEGTPCDTLSTGIREIKSYKNNQLNIFPNPCFNNCQIQYKPAKSIGNISITNLQGKVIFKEENIPVTLLQHGYEINTSAFAKGVYFVTLVSGDQNVVKKLVRL